MRVVAPGESVLRDLLRATDALRDVAAGHLDVDASRVGALRTMHVEESPHLLEHLIEHAGLVPRRGPDGVAVHRVARPHDGAALAFHGPDQRRQLLADRPCAHAGDEHQAAGVVSGVQALDEAHERVRGDARADLDPDRVPHTAQELHVRPLRLARAVSDPQQMRGVAVPVPGGGVDPRERLLVAEEQRFVRGVERGLMQGRGGGGGDPARLHEVERLLDPVGQHTVALGLRRLGDEVEAPPMHPVEIRVAALRQRPKQAQGGGGLEVGAQHPFGVGGSRAGVELDSVDDVAAVRRKLHAPAGLGR